MTPKETPSKKVGRERYAVYWEKAMDFYEAMVDASQKKNWNGVGLSGVHACISATDALLVKHSGVRSSSDAHQDAVGLLKSKLKHVDIEAAARRLGRILAEKNLIEYMDKSYTPEEASALKINVDRCIEWAKRLI